jgi:predicted nuclease of predicted toxin-antitoxin system
VSHRPKFLIDECLHTTLVKVAHDRQYEAYHVVHLGMAGSKDHELMARIEAEDFTLVTNNAVDFRRRFREQAVHPGLVILIPSVTPSVQRLLFSAALGFIGERDLLNRVIEVDLKGKTSVIREYEFPPPDAPDPQ